MRERDLIEGLSALGLRRTEVALVQLLPLVQVAWAEGTVAPPERTAILDFARDGRLLDGRTEEKMADWLGEEPTEEVFVTAQRLLVHLIHRYGDVDERLSHSTIPRVLEGCQVVAGASGGFLGVGRISPREKNAIAEIRRAFELFEVEAANDPHNQGGVGWATLNGEVDEVLAAEAPAVEVPAVEVPAVEVPAEEPPAVEPLAEVFEEPAEVPVTPDEPLVIAVLSEALPAEAVVEPAAEREAAWRLLITLQKHRAEHAELLPDSPALPLLDARIAAARADVR